MRKTHKKIDCNIRLALKEVCELALHRIEGFKWLTHIVNYSLFPSSLMIICVFQSNEALTKASSAKKDDYLANLIATKLLEIDVKLENIDQQVRFDTEENCMRENNGKWHERLH